MKNIAIHYTRTTLLTLFISLLVYSCADQTLDATDPNTEAALSTEDSGIVTSESNLDNPFQKTVGAAMEKSVGLLWVDNYIKANGKAFEYLIKAEAIRQILSQSGCNGVSLRYGRDERGKLHIFPVGVDDKGREMKADYVAISNGSIDWETSKSFSSRYDGSVRSHFFGANTFERLFKNKDCSEILVEAALDNDNRPRLLLTNKNAPDPSFVEDESSPCPPYCENQF